MIYNFIKISLRQFSKGKVHALINISGLAIGLACFILLSLFVRYELSYDDFYTDKDLIYQVYSTDTTSFQPNAMANIQGAPAGPLFVESIPEVVSYTRFASREDLLAKANGNRFIIPKLFCTDAETVRFFDVNLFNSNASTFELEKGQIIISQSEAEKLYGSAEEAIGQLFEIIDYDQFIVKDVFEDLPENTHMALDYVISLEHITDLLYFQRMAFKFSLTDWRVSAFTTYIKTNRPIEDFMSIESKMETALIPYRGNRRVKLVNLAEIQFSSWNTSVFKTSGDKKYIGLYMAIALIVLLVAIVNYTNLSTARFSKRAKEVGIRKTVGAHRTQLIQQFLIESISITIVSLILAICLTEAIMPYFNVYTGKSIGIDYTAFSTYLVFIGLSLSIGLLAGAYPSLFLSRFSPQLSLNKVGKGKQSGLFRQVLVGFQFAICLALMAVTGIVYDQHKHMRTVDLGFSAEQVVRIPLNDKKVKQSYINFRDELLKSPQLTGVKGASANVFGEEFIVRVDIDGWAEDARLSMTYISAEEGFIELMKIQKDQGQLFSELENKESHGTFAVNQALVEATGWEEPLGKQLMGAEVTAVVKDFIYGSARETISPIAIFESKLNVDNGGGFEDVFVRINGNIPAAMAHIERVFNEFSADYPFEYNFVDDDFAAKYETEKRLSEVFGIFSLLAVFIAGLGILGLSIFLAETRIKEIGIRKILGAAVKQIVWLLNGGTTVLILGIAVITLPLVYYFMQQWLQEFAFKIDLNWAYFITPLLILLAVVWSIQLHQSLKSARANPVKALRNE